MPASSLLSRWAAQVASSRTALLDAQGPHTYAALDARARAVAAALLEGRGSLAGERVALLAEPGAPFVEALYGIFLAGGCAVVLSPLHPAAESLYFCTDAQVRTVLVEGALADSCPRCPPGCAC